MEFVSVASQVELDAAIADGVLSVEIADGANLSVDVPGGVVLAVKTLAGALLRVVSGRVEAWGSSRVEAWESSSVVARESSSVVAWGSSRVEAWAAAAISLFGAFVKAKASANVSVHLHKGAACEGGVQIPIEQPSTASEWCAWYGVDVVGEDALLFKGVNEDFRSNRGASYLPGSETVASDWDGGKKECGCGLHFSPSAYATRRFLLAEKYVACLVPLSSIAVHPDGKYPEKVKAERCWNWYECNVHGEQIGERFDKPAAV